MVFLQPTKADLLFQTTPNTENYQARYIVTHPATGDFSCEAGKKYLKQLKERRTDELEMLTYLTGKNYSDWDVVSEEMEEKQIPTEASYNTVASIAAKTPVKANGILYATLGVLGLISFVGFRQRNKKQ